MKYLYSIIFVLLISNFVFGQKKIFKEILEEDYKNSGVMLSDNNTADGYYIFSEVGKKDKRNRIYALKLLDINLNVIATKKITLDKKSYLSDVAYNGEQIAVSFYDDKNDKAEIYLYASDGNFIKKYTKDISYKKVSVSLYPMNNNGFVIIYRFKIKLHLGDAYIIERLSPNADVLWTLESPIKKNRSEHVSLLSSNDQSILFLINSGKSADITKKFKEDILVAESATGRIQFKKNMNERKIPFKINSAFFSKENNIYLTGDYFDEGKNVLNDKSAGIFIESYSPDGERLTRSLNSWKKEFAKYFDIKNKNKLKDIGYLYFHKFFEFDNRMFAIAESFRRKVTLLQDGAVSLQVQNAYLIEFNEKNKISDIHTFEKSKSKTLMKMVLSINLTGKIAKAIGAFDYLFTQLDHRRNRFYINFVDFKGFKGSYKKSYLKTLIYDDGKFIKDEIDLKPDKKVSRIFPSKLGKILIAEYDKSKREIHMHVESLNVR